MAGINQHYVPRYYLKTFSEDGKVFVWDKESSSYLGNGKIAVEKIAFGKKFYNISPTHLSQFLEIPTENVCFVDDILNEYNERISAPLIKSFITLGDHVNATKKEEIVSIVAVEDVIDFAIVQLFRTPFFRKQFEFTARDILKKYKDQELPLDYTIENIANAIHGVYILAAICNTQIWKGTGKPHLIKQMYRFIDVEIIQKIKDLRSLSKTLWISGVDECFITSDNPIFIVQDPAGHIKSASFAITKRCAFTFWSHEPANRSVVVIDENRQQVIKRLNNTMKVWALRFVYSNEKT